MKVLFVGFGSIASKHYQALIKLFPFAEYYALRSQVNANKITGIINVFSWQEVPIDLTFAIISTPTFRHTADIRNLVNLKIPFFIEKPISDKLDYLDQLRDEINECKLETYVACNLRFLPALQFLDKEIKKGEKKINEVVVYAGSYLPDWRPHTNYKEGYSANEIMGGGVHLDLFHELDYVMWILGTPESSTVLKRSRSTLNINSVDFASYSLVYPNYVATIILNYYRRVPKRSIEIVFEDEVWIIDLLKNTIKDEGGTIIFEDTAYSIKDTYLDQMKYFTMSLLEGERIVLNTFQESLEVLKICLKSNEIN